VRILKANTSIRIVIEGQLWLRTLKRTDFFLRQDLRTHHEKRYFYRPGRIHDLWHKRCERNGRIF